MLLKVAIIGAGIGGLCLGQALKAAGIDVDIYERDSAPEARRQGYRLHLDADGVGALRASLPSKLFDLFEATSMAPLRYTTLMDTDFSIRRRFVTDDYSKTEDHLKSGAAIHLNVNRATLRELLLLGLENCVHFDKTLLRYDSQERDVEVFFDDRTSTRCDLLVGADGANSVVRSQRVPAATSMDSGARAIYGRLSVPAARAVLPAHALADVFTAASDSRKLILGVGPVIYPIRPDLAAASLAPDYALASQDDYVGCIVAGRKEFFGDDRQSRASTSDDLQKLAADLVSPWPAKASAVLEAAEKGSFFFVEMTSSVPTAVAPPTNVTFLGDAIHTMTPSLGRGANVALKDAERLGRAILESRDGLRSLPTALAQYETRMLADGFEVVRHSAEMGSRLLGQDPLPI